MVIQVHGDVFRPCANPLMFSALIGSGYQVTFVVFIVVCFAIIGDLYTE
jgi:transmembrane 9 superfamily protein 3